MVVIEHDKITSHRPFEQKASRFCIFEHVYFSRPESMMDDVSVYKARLRMGEALARKILREWPDHDIDVVIGPFPPDLLGQLLHLGHGWLLVALVAGDVLKGLGEGGTKIVVVVVSLVLDRLVHVHAKDARLDRRKLDQVGILATPLQYHTPKLPGLGDVDWSDFFSGLYRVGYDGPVIIEHEDRLFEGTDEKIKRGFLVARDQLRPFIR